MESFSTTLNAERQDALRALQLDALTTEVMEAFDRSGVRSILLKGRAVERWLYADGTSRRSTDVDLLIDPMALPDAESTLRSHGFKPGQRGWRDVSRAWARGRGETVDLHTGLFGLYAPSPEVWRRLSSSTEAVTVGGRSVEVLGLAARAAHVATHAAQHGFEGARKPIADLERAVAQLGLETWRDAAALAEDLEGLAAFSAGLRMSEGGRSVADRLALDAPPNLLVHLHAEGADPLVLGLEALSASRGVRGKARFGLRKLTPSPAYMRAHSSLARRGAAGLGAAYLWRPFWLAWRLPGALAAWRRAKADLERPQHP